MDLDDNDDKAHKDSKYSGNCMSCHNMTADGNGVALWDLVKYKKMIGIENVADVEGEFSFTQDKTQSMSEVFSYDWMHSDADNLRHALGVNGANVQPPQEMFDNWEITIDGLVENPYTIKLPELIAKAEEAGVVKTKISKMTCDWCAVGGGGILFFLPADDDVLISIGCSPNGNRFAAL